MRPVPNKGCLFPGLMDNKEPCPVLLLARRARLALGPMNPSYNHSTRIRGAAFNAPNGSRRPQSRNRQWNAADASSKSDGPTTNNHPEGERWERGGGRGGQRARGRGRGGRKFPNQTLRNTATSTPKDLIPTKEYDAAADVEEEMDFVQGDSNEDLYATDFEFPEIEEPDLETQEERERFYQEVYRLSIIFPMGLTFLLISW